MTGPPPSPFAQLTMHLILTLDTAGGAPTQCHR